MTDSNGVVQKAIDKVLTAHQKIADEERLKAPKREAAQKQMDQLLDDLAALGPGDEAKVTDEMIAAFSVFQNQLMQKMAAGDKSGQMAMARFDQEFLKKVFESLNNDQARMQSVQVAAQQMMADTQPSKIKPGQPMFDVAVSEPEDQHGEWTFAVVLVEIDENYQAKLVDKLKFDLYLTTQITPSENLSGEFNVPGKSFKKGESFEPVVVKKETKENGPQSVLHIKGHIYDGGRYLQPVDYPPIPLEKRQPQTLDMDALKNMFGDGGGPNNRGPN